MLQNVLYAAGQESTATTLHWALLLMARHTDIQKRIHEELDREVSGCELVLADRQRLRFTESVLNEVQRFSGVVPLSAHRTLQEVNFKGYTLPAGTIVLPNLYAILHDTHIWKDATHFNPDANFPIDSPDADALRSLPFGVGRRACIGETLARQELFMFFAGILQRFEIAEHPNCPLPSEAIGSGCLIRAPLPFYVCFKPREIRWKCFDGWFSDHSILYSAKSFLLFPGIIRHNRNSFSCSLIINSSVFFIMVIHSYY